MFWKILRRIWRQPRIRLPDTESEEFSYIYERKYHDIPTDDESIRSDRLSTMEAPITYASCPQWTWTKRDCQQWLEAYQVHTFGTRPGSARTNALKFHENGCYMFEMSKEEWVYFFSRGLQPGQRGYEGGGAGIWSHLNAIKCDGYLGGGNVPVGLYAHEYIYEI
jgi:hypothetical protein